MKKVLVTGAGSGLGKLFSLELAKRSYTVYAGVELPSQITSLRNEAKDAGVQLNVFKLDITDDIDVAHAKKLEIDILVNNAGLGEGGSITDMPMAVLERQFAVNFFSTINFTKQFIRQFVDRKAGRIIFISSVAGLITSEFNGAYCASKHALGAAAEVLQLEMKDFNVSVATINPGPYDTGFNDRLIEACTNWYDKDTAIINHDNLSFAIPQTHPEKDIAAMVDVIVDNNSKFRNVFPLEFVPMIKQFHDEAWEK